jgi:hypothetical protein
MTTAKILPWRNTAIATAAKHGARHAWRTHAAHARGATLAVVRPHNLTAKVMHG